MFAFFKDYFFTKRESLDLFLGERPRSEEMSTAKPLDETHDKNDITSLAAEKAGEAHSQMSEVDNDKKYLPFA